MKKVMKKKNYSNRFIYLLVTLGIFILVAGGVYAITSSGANSGHPASDVDFSSGINSAGTVKFWNANAAQGIYVKQISVSDSWADNDANTQANGVYSKGNIKSMGSVSAGSFLYTASDRNLKTNIEPLQNSLSKVLQLQGVSFNLKSNGQKSDGLIAQDVEKVFPELVLTDSSGLKSVAYGNLVGVLVEAIKEQQKQIDELKSICG